MPAKQLQLLISRADRGEEITEAELKAAYKPLKAFRTRSVNAGMPSFEIVEPHEP